MDSITGLVTLPEFTQQSDGTWPKIDPGQGEFCPQMIGTSQRVGIKLNPDNHPDAFTVSYGSRMYYGNSQYSALFGVVSSGSTGISVTATGGAVAGYLAVIEDAGIKTNADDDLACFAGRINATVDQTLGDWHGLNLYMRNSDKALTNWVKGSEIQVYVGSGGSLKNLRGSWYDFLEQSSSPPARNWIMYGGQLTLASGGSGNVTGFYFKNNSSADHAVYGLWLAGRLLYGIKLNDVTLDSAAGSFHIVLSHLGTSDDVGILCGAGAPATVLSGINTGRGKGSLYIDTTNGRLYINQGTAASPTWAYFDSTT